MKLKPANTGAANAARRFPVSTGSAPSSVDDIGVETLMWGSDYPHPDGVWPESSKYIEEQFEGPARLMSCTRSPAKNAGKFFTA